VKFSIGVGIYLEKIDAPKQEYCTDILLQKTTNKGKHRERKAIRDTDKFYALIWS